MRISITVSPAATPIRNPKRAAVIRLLLLAGLVGGCSAIGPTGVNKSTTAITAVNTDGEIVLKFKIPADATKADFRITNKPDDSTLGDQIDDSPDGTDKEDGCNGVDDMFCVAFAPGDLTANVYLVDVFIDDAEEKSGTLAFVVGADAGATDDAEASGAAAEDADG